MKIQRLGLACAVMVCGLIVSSPAHCDENPDAAYRPGPDAERHDGVPIGRVTKHTWTSEIFPGTVREYYVYVPQQYDGIQPACVMIFQDGHAYVSETGQVRATVVMDNLIHAGELPVIVGVFVNPGHRNADFPQSRWRASNRSFEYDTLSDQYSRFLATELLPHIESDMHLNLSPDPQDRAVCGASSGGICAFTAAWTHPEWFGRVMSHIGSFTNIRGGHVYPALIRKTERKPLKVFLQDGENDLDNQHGNWWLANKELAAALKFQKYDFTFVTGTGGHSLAHGGAVFPESMKWLWHDHVVGDVENTEKADATQVYQEKSVRLSDSPDSPEEYRYRLMKPLKIADDATYPLVVFLHGAGERGTDNVSQLKYFPEQMAQPRWRHRFPCYVVAPQCRPDKRWVEVDWGRPETHEQPAEPSDQMKVVMKIIERTMQEERVDQRRVYVTGLSMGGYGTWDLAMRRPDLFAAVAPICGGADNSRMHLLKNVPVWVVHGAEDRVVPTLRSRLAVQALREAGGHPVYIEYPGVGHNSWTPAYTDNDGLVPWMFRQRRL